MYTNRIGNITNVVLSENEINHLWQGLKALEKYGQDPACVGIIDNGLVKRLIVDLSKASVRYFESWGPISEAICNERQEHCVRHIKLAKITEERHQEEIDRVVKRYIARENKEGLGKISSEGITEKDIAGYKTDMSHVQQVKKKKGKKK